MLERRAAHAEANLLTGGANGSEAPQSPRRSEDQRVARIQRAAGSVSSRHQRRQVGRLRLDARLPSQLQGRQHLRQLPHA